MTLPHQTTGGYVRAILQFAQVYKIVACDGYLYPSGHRGTTSVVVQPLDFLAVFNDFLKLHSLMNGCVSNRSHAKTDGKATRTSCSEEPI